MQKAEAGGHDQIRIEGASGGSQSASLPARCGADHHRDLWRDLEGAIAWGRVELRGFGAFAVKRREARVGRNPRSGVNVHVPEKHVPFFKTGKQLRHRLNQAS